ncbi:AlpA family phage regulatory protein [Pseudomonas sp. 10B1]|uniref:helix-turn-helix transcriptional regulator n=1 Tax=unclassified Pseudomonas TaxID=196821 RepID=UPI002B238F49|nr:MULTISPECIES: AlpA family phage regulatory protein [unclassified Pseudomonas]MEA9994575.1 AlpA family phage regulatory protein [Pseudomonas sp. AA4]MEB0085720.1 AlpA family phage regulatory protein [Pseudomonas sp. RTI1]MEB0125955.1 AlpA family phage regulatory protein [Pseudomonas sp. CCC1.2]MEB0152759.1 AlpA family phage regulatory protein [Pseudomonas sp. CCC4.3]MEB0221264.1 AlpA family phage regulatory protein [Pseudomonas sp. AB12(2023)]
MKFDTHRHTSKEVIEALSISRATLWRWEKMEGFPAPLKVGVRRVRYDIGSIKAFLSNAGPLEQPSQSQEIPPPQADSAPAFPSHHFEDDDLQGISTRDYFASKAMQAVISEGCYDYEEGGTETAAARARFAARDAYLFADAMLAERNK